MEWTMLIVFGFVLYFYFFWWFVIFFFSCCSCVTFAARWSSTISSLLCRVDSHQTTSRCKNVPTQRSQVPQSYPSGKHLILIFCSWPFSTCCFVGSNLSPLSALALWFGGWEQTQGHRWRLLRLWFGILCILHSLNCNISSSGLQMETRPKYYGRE